jgi:hypothetical protein
MFAAMQVIDILNSNIMIIFKPSICNSSQFNAVERLGNGQLAFALTGRTEEG